MADLESLYEAILKGKLDVAKAVTTEAIAENVDPQEIINGYMSRAMEDIGKRFEEGKAFVPELLMAARAMKGEKLKVNMNDYMGIKFPNAFRIAERVCKQVERNLRCQLSEVEIGYLAMHIERVADEELDEKETE